MITFKSGNIFTSQCQTIVNAVNCVGFMGAGIALEFKLRYPQMFEQYQAHCQSKALTVGKLWHYKDTQQRFGFRSVLNLPTKQDWKQPSELKYVEMALQRFVDTYQKSNITSIAFPMLGVGRGGLAPELVLEVMQKYLSQCPELDIEIWQFEPQAEDDLYPILAKALCDEGEQALQRQLGLTQSAWSKVLQAMQNPRLNSVCAIGGEKGIGEKTLAKLIEFCVAKKTVSQTSQPALFG